MAWSEINSLTKRRVAFSVEAMAKRPNPYQVRTLQTRVLAVGDQLVDIRKSLAGSRLVDRLAKRKKKKDDPGTQDVSTPTDQFVQTPPASGQKKKEKKMKLKKILKSAIRNRTTVIEAVQKKAAKIAKKTGISPELAEGKVWARRGGEAQAAYESVPAGKPKRAEPKMMKITSAESELDERARKRMKRTGETYAKACSAELMADANLYTEYEKELAAGSTYDVPAPAVQYSDPFV